MATNFLNFGSELDAIFADVKQLLTDETTDAANAAKILATLETIISNEQQILAALTEQTALINQILGWAVSPPAPTQIVLALPTITRKGVLVPNYELKDDTVATVPILTTNSAGVVEPPPTGDIFSVTSSNPASLTAAIGQTAAGNPAVVLTPLVQASPGLTFTVSDSAGLKVATQIVDIVQDTTPTNIILDLADATTVPQPVPTPPGP